MPDTFADLGLPADLLAPLAALGYEEPTQIQREAIPLLLAGRDVLGQAATGTGKTAAFALPLLARLDAERPRANRPGVLALVPTRELANQVAEAFHRYGAGAGRVVVSVYGGQDFRRQVLALKRGAHVVVATPGRALDHLRQGTLDLSDLQAVVLDEADEMLDMGFAEDIESILALKPDDCQVALFSATMPPRIAAIADTHLNNPARVTIARETPVEGEAPRVRQVAYLVPRSQRLDALGRVLDVESPALALVFCRTRLEVDELAQALGGHGFRVEALHGGMSQEQRERVMKKSRGGHVDLLIATDVAARGIDIGHLSHVVNFGVPESPDTYLHRIGRTGRAGREGVAITIAEPRQRRLVQNIERATRREISIEAVPSLSDVHARRLDLTRVAVREALEARDFEAFRGMAEGLAADFEPLDVAAAALQLAHRATAGDGGLTAGEAHDPFATRPEWRGGERSEGGRGEREPRFARGARNGRERPAHDADRGGPDRGPRGPLRQSEGMVRVRVSAGRRLGIRPGDLVGAITNEGGVDARAIGAIDIADHYSLVEIDAALADRIAGVLGRTWLRGQRVTAVRYDPAADAGADESPPAGDARPRPRKGPPRAGASHRGHSPRR